MFDSFYAYCQIDVIHTDLAKAFDRINHSMFISTYSIGIGEPLLYFSFSFHPRGAPYRILVKSIGRQPPGLAASSREEYITDGLFPVHPKAN